MVWILLPVLFQCQSPEKPVEWHVEEFLKGSERASAELKRLGVYSIRPLLKARERKPRQIDALLFEIKSAAAHPSPVTLPGAFEHRRGMTQNREWPDVGALVPLFIEKGIPLFTDQFDEGRLKTRMALFNPATRLQLIELFCQETGLDYGFFHNSVVVGLPERLWPERRPIATPLSEPDLVRAREWIKNLESDSIEVREAAAQGLLGLGAGIRPLLEEWRSKADPEMAARCDAIASLLGRETCRFGRASCLRQELSPDDEVLFKKLTSTTPKLAVTHAPISEILAAIREACGVTFEIEKGTAGASATVHTSGQSLLDLLSLITQSLDLDFLIIGGKVVIDSRRAIEKRLSTIHIR